MASAFVLFSLLPLLKIYAPQGRRLFISMCTKSKLLRLFHSITLYLQCFLACLIINLRRSECPRGSMPQSVAFKQLGATVPGHSTPHTLYIVATLHWVSIFPLTLHIGIDRTYRSPTAIQNWLYTVIWTVNVGVRARNVD